MNSSTVAYFKHGIGNLIMMTPALQMLAAEDNSGKIDLAMDSTWNDPRRAAFDELIGAMPFVNHVINYPKENIRDDYKRWYWVGHAEPSPTRDVFARYRPNTLPLPDWRGSAIHEIWYYIQQIWAMKIRERMIPKQWMTTKDPHRLAGEKRLKIGICNGTYAKNMIDTKRWDKFPELVDILRLNYDCAIIKVGYQDELSDVKNADYDFVNQLSILETAGVIDQLDLFVTVDTGLMHVADALEKKMLVIFGGSLISKNGPVSRNAHVVRLGLPCQPCQRTGVFTNCKNPLCLTELSTGKVMQWILKIL